ncbi:HlyD family efflux transporter periplasmic adaptor subunit [bacterium]|nr:HlyD family efflux transporter periplasmic adaptor subunit [bacterium]
MKSLIILILSASLFVGCENQEKVSHEIIHLPLQKNQEYLEFRGLAFSKEESSLSTPRKVNGSISFIVENGTEVKKGDLLVEVNSKRQNNSVKKLKNRLFYARRRLKSEKEKVAKSRLASEIDVLEKEYAYTIQRIEIKYKSGEKDLRVLKSLDLQTQLLDEKLGNLKDKMESYMVLVESNSISLDAIEKMKKELTSTRISRDLQKLVKTEKVQGVVGREKEELLLELDLLKHNLEKSKLVLEEKEKLFPLDIEKRELIVKKRQSGLNKVLEAMKDSSMYSKVDGVFMRVKHPWNGNYIEKGTDVWRGMTLGKVLDYQNISVKFRLPEKYVDLVKVGMNIEFYSLQKPSQVLKTKVKKIESIATPMDPMNRKSAKFHWLFIDMDAKGLKFLPSETFLCKIQLNSFENSIYVPRELANIEDGVLQVNTSEGLKSFQDFEQGLDYYILLNQDKALDIHYVL